jgi:hypothetical protein
LTEVTDAVIRNRSSEVEQLILTERLVKQPGARLTLEQIAQRAIPVITRERVRQLERRLIDALSDALLFDDYRDLAFCFRTEFADRWKAAAGLSVIGARYPSAPSWRAWRARGVCPTPTFCPTCHSSRPS